MGQAQDAAAPDEHFAAFVLTAQPRLRRTAYLICGDWHHAEDIVQTALAQVYSRWPRLSANGDPGGYVHRAVVNAAIDERRRPWRRELAAAYLPDRSAQPDDGLTVEVLGALARLPRRQRAVVVLRYVEDTDVETTAALLGISPGTVKSQSAKGLAVLRVTLSDDRGVLR
jgi:RNA polymerase sigma-70 factor (sigma-E family)